LNGTFLAVWLAHTGFGLALATYLLYNYVSTLPRETFESAFIDGASHFTVFTKLVLPLSVPALASFAIFQFLWVWKTTWWRCSWASIHHKSSPNASGYQAPSAAIGTY
jgi:ABC-type glycerol-3-phosphate transport system permease component